MIEIILEKEFIKEFGKLTESGINLEKILLNQNNFFIVSKSLLEYIDHNINNSVSSRWNSLFVSLSDNKKIKSIKNQDTLDVDEIYKSVEGSRNLMVILKNSTMPEQSDEHIYYLRDNSKNNTLLMNILQKNEIVFRNLDFVSNDELFSFIDKMFCCSKTNNRIIVESRYSNFDCKIIDLLKARFEKKSYWTTFKSNDNSNNLTYLKSKLGNKLMVYATTNDKLHGRKIIIDSLIIDFDDDFNKIDIESGTWTGICTVNSDVANSLRKKQDSLTRLH